jgi:TolB-like protein/Tfp pilus assembly protein PilF
MAGISDFIRELRRRNVFRVVAAYAVAAWLVIQIASIVLPAFHAAEWIMQATLVLVVLCFPLAIAVSWSFELTPEGLKREEDVDRSKSTTAQFGRKLDLIVIAVLTFAVAFFVLDKFAWDGNTNEKTQANKAEFENSIAVLPFANMSGDESNNPFTNGIHDDLLTHLSKIGSLKTISRTSVLQYRDTSKSIPEIARELGVATILEGGVQRSGDRVRINVQLIDAESDAHLWAETYDRQLTAVNIFAIQTEISTSIAEALQATLSPIERQNIANVPTENLDAYEAYQLGRQAFARRSTTSIAEAIDYFTGATTIDPGFAEAWAGLSDAYRTLASYSGQNEFELRERAREAVDRALELNDQLSEPHTSLATLLQMQGDDANAILAIKRALKLNPNDADARVRYGDLLHEAGELQQSLLEFELAAKLDPLSPFINSAYAFTLAEVGRFDEALARHSLVVKLDPDFPMGATSIGTIYGLAYGRLDLANLWYRKALVLDPGNPWHPAILGLVFLELNDDETAEFWIRKSLKMSPQHPWANGAMMMLQSYRGNLESVRRYADAVLGVDPRWRLGTALAHGRVADIRAGNHDIVLERHERSFPELFGSVPEVNLTNYRTAIDIAGVLQLVGDDDHATSLLQASQEQIAERIRVGFYGFWVSDVQIYALQGKTDVALAALRQAIDQGWRTDWRFFFYVDPNLDNIRDAPEFEVMLQEVKEDMAVQLERAREMDANGELPTIPN